MGAALVARLQAGRSVIKSLRSRGNIVEQLTGSADLRLYRRELLPCKMELLFGLGEFRIPQFRLGLLG